MKQNNLLKKWSVLSLTGMFLLCNAFQTIDANAQTKLPAFSPGDVFAAVGDGKINWYAPNGKLIQILDTGLGGATTGMAFDKDSNLYVTNFVAATVSKFDRQGHLLGKFGFDFGNNPESIVFDKDGNVYVGHAGESSSLFEASDIKLRKFKSDGILINTYELQKDERGTDWIDLAADQCTLFYTSEGHSVLRYDVCANRQLPALTNDLHGEAYALRILGDGGVLVADSIDIHRLDTNGKIIETYDVSGEDYWFALNRDPDGKSFWSGNLNTGNIYKFEIDSGKVLLGPIHVCDKATCLGGLAIYGELTEAITPEPALAQLPTLPWYFWLLPLALLPFLLIWLWLRNRSSKTAPMLPPQSRNWHGNTNTSHLSKEQPKTGADIEHGRLPPRKRG